MKFTKGEWRKGSHNDEPFARSCLSVFREDGRRIAEISREGFMPIEEAEANAQLIASAPLLYEELKYLPEPKSLLAEAAYTGGDVPKKWINDRGFFNDGYNQALKDIATHREQALAKAETE